MANLEVQLKESKSRLEEFELHVSKEKEASKKLEKELLMYKREVVEQHEKGFHNTIRQVGFIAKDRDLSHFYLFKDVKDSVMLDEEDIVVEGEVGEE